jgi:hypothetical protein
VSVLCFLSGLSFPILLNLPFTSKSAAREEHHRHSACHAGQQQRTGQEIANPQSVATEHAQPFGQTAEQQPPCSDEQPSRRDKPQPAQDDPQDGIPQREFEGVGPGGRIVREVFDQLTELLQQEL